MLLALASFLVALSTQETRTETWPGGGKKAEYEVERDAQGDEVKHGKYRSWFEGGTLASEGAYAHGKETGPWVLYHPDGAKAASGSYADGLESGPWETFSASGKPLSKGAYVRGAMDGRWTFWKEDGTKDNVASGLYKLEVHRSKETGRHYRGYFVDNVRQGTWTSHWPDRSVQLEGRFTAGKREGPWVFRHQDGTPSLLLLSGEYSAGSWAGPLSDLEAPPIELAKLPAPEPYQTGWPADRGALAASLEQALAARTLDEGTRRALARAGIQALPVALELWRTLDPESPDGRRALGFLEEAVLRPLCSGHALTRHGLEGPPDASSARECLRAWLSLWALTRLDQVFWEVDVPGPSRAGIGLRDLLQDPPLLERDARYDPTAAP